MKVFVFSKENGLFMVFLFLEVLLMNFSPTKKMVLAAMFLALGLLLPLLVGHIIPMGYIFLPMHIPVLLCGFICGGPWGLAVGAVTPLLSGVITGMPPIYPTAVAMAFELAAYGLLAGVFYKLFPKKIGFIYLSLVLAMLGGRVVWSIVSFALYGIAGTAFTWDMLLGGAFVTVFPGIIVQLVLIPAIMIALQLGQNKRRSQTEAA